MIRALIFDLDDTLYDERLYVRSGFRAVAGLLAKRSGLEAEAIAAMMEAELDRNGRGKVFDRVLARLGLPHGPAEIQALVRHYRHHRPRLRFHDGVEGLLQGLKARWPLAVVTDGLPLMQRHKVQALGLERLVPVIVYTWELNAPKPDPGGLLEAVRRLGVQPEEAVVIGDNPAHDLPAARAAGMPCIRVRQGRFAAEEAPADSPAACEIDHLHHLEAALLRLDQREESHV